MVPSTMAINNDTSWRRFSCDAGGIYCHLILQGANAAHVGFPETSHTKALDFLSKHGIIVQPLPPHSALARQIDNALAAYAAGTVSTFLKLFGASPFLTHGTTFQRLVWEEISRIPYGATITYGELANRLGNPGYARAVGQACHTNPLALVIPCHRVVAAHGLGGFAGEITIKEKLISLEQRNAQGRRTLTPQPS